MDLLIYITFMQKNLNDGLEKDAFTQKQDELKSEMEDEVGKYVDVAKDYVESAAHKVEDVTRRAKNKGKDLLDEAQDKVQDGVKDAREKMRDVSEQADEYAHQNPWPLVAAAAIGGLLIGLFSSRCRHRD